jgi:ABC-type Fe3+/spermidine/putrescine transport system ATPase subunit
MSALSIQGVSFAYPRSERSAVNEVSLEVSDGEILCLVGPSGCGKTTLLRLISGLLVPDAGIIRFGDRDMSGVPVENRGATMVFQNHLLFPFLSVLDNVGFGLRMRGVSRKEWEPTARRMLERVQLGSFADRRPGSLSGGQKQRVALARALVAEPAVLLLDEPLSNLDRHLREDMRQAILELQRESGVTTVCVTHDQEEAVLLGDRIAMMSDGDLLQVGEAEAFYERPVSVHVARFFGNHNQIEAARSGDAIVSDLGRLRITPRPGQDASWPSEGPVCVHVRPESISLARAGSVPENALHGRVTHRVYVGTHIRYAVEVGGQPWQIVASPQTTRFAEGDEIDLVIPPDRIWLTRE